MDVINGKRLFHGNTLFRLVLVVALSVCLAFCGRISSFAEEAGNSSAPGTETTEAEGAPSADNSGGDSGEGEDPNPDGDSGEGEDPGSKLGLVYENEIVFKAK